MSWMQDDGAASLAVRKPAHPNNRRGECPWAQDTDVQQFKRGPPSRNIKSPGNPINHTGYPDMAPQRNYKKTMSGKGGGGVPWAQDEVDSFAKPQNAIGAGLSGQSSAMPSARYQKGEMMAPQMDSYYAQPINDDDGPDGAPYPDDMDPREIAYMQEMMARQQEMQQQQYQQQSRQMDDISPTKGGKADAVCPWAQVYHQPLVTESRANFQGQQILKPRSGAPHGNGKHLGDENYNMLHDHTGIDGGKSFQKEQQQRTSNEQALYMGQQANMDSRQAAQEIRDRMRVRDNVINWGGMQ